MTPRITAAVPLRELPRWALLERELLSRLDRAWREFERRFCEPDGRLRYHGRMYGRDGVDDFYEPFFNWPTLYRIGGSPDLLTAAKRHWEGVTRQLSEYGYLRDEYEIGYDWFHQGESLPFLLGICAADPADTAFRARARRFAELYLPGSDNYDPATHTIVAPHTGAGGPRWGVGEDWAEYRADQPGMQIYGLPLFDVPGVDSWDDLRDPDAARAMGQAMQQRMGRGDTAVNLAATTLAVNAWLYDHDEGLADWVLEYVDAWRERAAANGGLLPDNVGPSGQVGELHGGAWYGGHYGWTWPHGLHSILPAATVAALNAVVLTGRVDRLDLVDGTLDAVLAHGEVADGIAARGSLGPGWAERLGADETTRELLVPYRHGPQGWFDRHPVPLTPVLWRAWARGDIATDTLIERLRAASDTDWEAVRWFHDKEEQGHEAPWIGYLAGRNPDYPERGLELALTQTLRRMALITEAPDEPQDGDIHFWQRLNPVVTEVLSHLVTGAPPAIYYGGLPLARVVIGDVRLGRPGLPADVAALVTTVEEHRVVVELVNTGDAEQLAVVQAGAFGEDEIVAVGHDVAAPGYPGDAWRYDVPPVTTVPHRTTVGGARLEILLPARTRITLDLDINRRAYRAAHQHFAHGTTQEEHP
ncbi:hypothetical protein O7614_16960 [Micromonospora sp. WMMD961]|uniref:hypothetical protein n=1 Tax=Micromonospora sp. WMMD961 TaxID=3016100 RepID=UPI002417F7DD|nr:hypothetical protein [Micromonospora sp. WMMD961]MDG4781342.1 hypothetical protein [Micromonospora sp. WMMD961]